MPPTAPTTTDRFNVQTHEATPRPYYSVTDASASTYHMQGRAVSLYFRSSANAHRVAQILNEEWRMFLADPY